MTTYDDWKLATPPEYEYLEKRPMREIPFDLCVRQFPQVGR